GSTGASLGFVHRFAEGTIDFGRILAGKCLQEFSLRLFGVCSVPVIPAVLEKIAGSQHAVTEMVVRVAFEDAFGNGNHTVEISLVLAQDSEIHIHDECKRIEAAGNIELRFRFCEAAMSHKAQGIILM